jgi:hypothetical protein
VKQARSSVLQAKAHAATTADVAATTIEFATVVVTRRRTRSRWRSKQAVSVGTLQERRLRRRDVESALIVELLVAHLDAVVLVAKLILASTAIALAIATAIENKWPR